MLVPLLLNFAALFLLIIVSAAVIAGNYRKRPNGFHIVIVLLLIPVFAEIRQLLVLYDLLRYVPLYLLLVYILLRLIGPLINYLVHLQLNKPFNFLSWVNLFTYLVFLYIITIGVRFFLSDSFGVEELLLTFKRDSILSITYPVIQLLHVGQAFYLLQSDTTETKKGIKYFVKVSVVVVVTMLVVLQAGYFLLERTSVELILAPIIFITVYSAILFIAIRYSAIFESSSTIKVLGTLSQRENEVIQKLIAGKTDKEIAHELHLSVNTIATYCRRIYTKLEVKNRTEATRKYFEL